MRRNTLLERDFYVWEAEKKTQIRSLISPWLTSTGKTALGSLLESDKHRGKKYRKRRRFRY